MAGRVLVDIATTGGPATLRAAELDPDAARSAMVLWDQNHVPVGVDAHFHAFDANLRRALGGMGVAAPAEALILEVDRAVDAGRSWQLGLAVIHALLAADRLATSEDEADRVIWVTGAVGTSAWEAQPVEAVTAKLARSAGRFAELAERGLPVEVIVPAAHREEARAAAPAQVRVTGIGPVAGLVAELTAPETAPPRPRTPPPRRRGATALLLLAAVAGAGALMADRIGPAVTGLMAAVSAGGASGSPPTGHGAPPAAVGDPAPAADAGDAAPSPDPGPAAPADAGAGAPREPAPSAAAYRLRRVEPEGEADCRMTDFLRLPMALAPAEPLPGGEMAADPRLCGIVLVPAGAGEDAPPGLRLVPPRDPGLAPLPPGFAAMAGTGIAPWRLTRPVRVDVIGAGGSAVHRFTLVPRP